MPGQAPTKKLAAATVEAGGGEVARSSDAQRTEWADMLLEKLQVPLPGCFFDLWDLPPVGISVQVELGGSLHI